MLKNYPSLLDMPQLVMEILEKLNFVEIACLRKVCHSLRNFIDDHRKEEKVDKMIIRVQPDHIEMRRSIIYISYKKHDDECVIKSKTIGKVKERIMENIDYLEAFMTDFKCFLSNPKLKLKTFEITFSWLDCGNRPEKLPEPEIKPEKGCLSIIKKFFGFENEQVLKSSDIQLDINILAKKVLGDIREYMKTRTTLLFIENLNINVDEEEELMEFLSYLDPNYLKKLSIFNKEEVSESLDVYSDLPNFDTKVLKLDKVKEMEHWKKLKTFISDEYKCDLPLKELLLFDKARVAYEKFTLEDALIIKEALFNSTNNKSYTINVIDEESLAETVRGLEKLFPPRNGCVWTFSIPNSNRKIHIQARHHRTIEFFTE